MNAGGSSSDHIRGGDSTGGGLGADRAGGDGGPDCTWTDRGVRWRNGLSFTSGPLRSLNVRYLRTCTTPYTRSDPIFIPLLLKTVCFRRRTATFRHHSAAAWVTGAVGHTNREIAAALYISASTAGVHVSNILRKLGAKRRVDAAGIAHKMALLPAR